MNLTIRLCTFLHYRSWCDASRWMPLLQLRCLSLHGHLKVAWCPLTCAHCCGRHRLAIDLTTPSRKERSWLHSAGFPGYAWANREEEQEEPLCTECRVSGCFTWRSGLIWTCPQNNPLQPVGRTFFFLDKSPQVKHPPPDSALSPASATGFSGSRESRWSAAPPSILFSECDLADCGALHSVPWAKQNTRRIHFRQSSRSAHVLRVAPFSRGGCLSRWSGLRWTSIFSQRHGGDKMDHSDICLLTLMTNRLPWKR